MRDDGLILRGMPVQQLPRRNRTWSTDRVCATEGCTTRISIYNKAKYCWAHAPVTYHIPRGRRKRATEPQAA